MMNEIIVSVICLCYNHEKYIRDALDGFVSQETDFRYEVIVHDDASTDLSPSIIKEYADLYPDIIKPIYQTENQFSKGIRVVPKYICPLCRGKYIAFCDGDDFWNSPQKLQKQVDFLEHNADYVACVHNTVYHYMATGKEHIAYARLDCDINFDNVISSGGSSYHLSSLLCKKDIFLNRPKWTYMVPGVGDYPTALYLAISGKIHYMADAMSCYRYGVADSWTIRMSSDYTKSIETKKNIIKMLHLVDQYTDSIHSQSITQAIAEHEYSILEMEEKYKQMKRPPYLEIYRRETIYRKTVLFFKQHFGGLYKLMKKIMR